MQHQGKAVNKMADTGAAAVQPQQPAAGAQPAAEKAAGGADLRKNLTQLPKHMAETIRKLSRRNKILIVVAVTAALVISILLSVMLNRVKYTALYSGLDASEAGEILSVLQDDKVDAKMSGTSTIMVPEDQADQLRVELAAKGYPKSGLSYDLFTEESKMGATDLETQTRLQYTLQENLRTTIKNMEIAEKIIGVKLQESDEALLNIVGAALSRFRRSESVTVRVSGGDYRRLSGSEEFTKMTDESGKQVSLERDPKLHPGDCILETENELIDCGADGQLERLDGILREGGGEEEHADLQAQRGNEEGRPARGKAPRSGTENCGRRRV